MFFKNGILLIFLCLASTSVFAQSNSCRDVKVVEITVGPVFSTLIRLDDRSCGGNGGWVCVVPQNDSPLAATVSDRVYSLAVAAKATDANMLVGWNPNITNGCGDRGFPAVTDLRMLP